MTSLLELAGSLRIMSLKWAFIMRAGVQCRPSTDAQSCMVAIFSLLSVVYFRCGHFDGIILVGASASCMQGFHVWQKGILTPSVRKKGARVREEV